MGNTDTCRRCGRGEMFCTCCDKPAAPVSEAAPTPDYSACACDGVGMCNEHIVAMLDDVSVPTTPLAPAGEPTAEMDRIRLVGTLASMRDWWRDVGNREKAFSRREEAKALAEGGEREIIAAFAELRARVASLTTERDAALALNGSPWPIKDVIAELSSRAEHLLSYHNCDCHGWEVTDAALTAAKAWIALTADHEEGGT